MSAVSVPTSASTASFGPGLPGQRPPKQSKQRGRHPTNARGAQNTGQHAAWETMSARSTGDGLLTAHLKDARSSTCRNPNPTVEPACESRSDSLVRRWCREGTSGRLERRKPGRVKGPWRVSVGGVATAGGASRKAVGPHSSAHLQPSLAPTSCGQGPLLPPHPRSTLCKWLG